FLLLVEPVRPNRLADSTVGLLDGWWAFSDPDLRGDYPLMGCPQWHRVFREQGFRPAAVPVPADSGLVVLIGADTASAMDREAPPSEPPARRHAAAKATVAARAPEGKSIQAWLCELIEAEIRKLDVAVVDRDQPFAELGADSLVAIETVNAL